MARAAPGLLLAACATAMAALQPGHALASAIKIGGWSGGPVVKDKRITSCQAEIATATQTALVYRVTPFYAWQLLVRNAAWRFTTGAKLPISLRLDNRDTLSTSATVRDGNILNVELSDAVGAFDRLRGAKSLQVRIGGLAVDFDLTGSGDVLASLTDCIRRTAQAAAGRPSAPSTVEAIRLEATALGKTAFQTAEILGMTATHDKVPGIVADAVWRSGPVFVTVAANPTNSNTETAMSAALAVAQRSCKGRFFAAAAPDVVDRLKIARGVAICQTMQSTVATYHLAAPRSKGGNYLIATSTIGADYGLFGRQPAAEMIARFKFRIANTLSQTEMKEKAHAQE